MTGVSFQPPSTANCPLSTRLWLCLYRTRFPVDGGQFPATVNCPLPTVNSPLALFRTAAGALPLSTQSEIRNHQSAIAPVSFVVTPLSVWLPPDAIAAKQVFRGKTALIHAAQPPSVGGLRNHPRGRGCYMMRPRLKSAVHPGRTRTPRRRESTCALASSIDLSSRLNCCVPSINMSLFPVK